MVNKKKEKRDQRKASIRHRHELDEQLDAAVAQELAHDAFHLQADAKAEALSGAFGEAVQSDGATAYDFEAATDPVTRRIEERLLARIAARSEAASGDAAAASGEGVATDGLARKTGGAGAGSRETNDAARGVKRRRLEGMTTEELKQAVGVELAHLVGFHDHNAAEPLFLVRLKAGRHTVDVPRHWEMKRAFLANQTDRESGEHVVADFVRDTGVAAVRNSEALGKPMDVRQMLAFRQRLHRAFSSSIPCDYRSPPLTRYGETYYEGKDLCHRFFVTPFVPGVLSKELRAALGIGADSPPPWLQAMQYLRQLPPSYPAAKYPGLNAPLPPGAQWGRLVGMWGEPPRNADGSLVFPEVMLQGARRATAPSSAMPLWGSPVEARATQQHAAQQHATLAEQAQPAPAARAPNKTAIAAAAAAAPSSRPAAAKGGLPPVGFSGELVRREVAASGVLAGRYVYEQPTAAGNTTAAEAQALLQLQLQQQAQRAGAASATEFKF